jgi:hypothetical protein
VERDFVHWWEPGFHWPQDLTPHSDGDLDCYIELFRRWGFEPCHSGALEPSYLKIAVYAEGRNFHHVAKQLPSGAWSSKSGALHDLRHDSVGALEGSGVQRMACVAIYMRREYDGTDPMDLEERGFVLP